MNLLKTLGVRYVFLCGFLIITGSMYSQDEYEKKEETPAIEPISVKTDSIDVSEKKEKQNKKSRKSDDSKAFQGMSDFKRNLRIGGSFNLGSYYESALQRYLFYFQISPQITYVLSEYFEGGITTSYSYTGTFGDVNSHAISAGPILRAYPLPSMFLQVEGLGFFNTVSISGYGSASYKNFNAFIGGGVVSRFTQTSYMLTGIKVNVMKNELTYNQIIPTAFISYHFGLW